MVSWSFVLLGIVLFTFLGIAWVMGYNMVKRRSPRHLPMFYMGMACFRGLTVLTFAALYIFLVSKSSAESKTFVVILFVLYALMMTITLKIKH